MTATVVAVSQSSAHRFSKSQRLWITLLAGLGVEGDAHAGRTVQHRSDAARDPSRPNLRQVHLLQRELLEALETRGFALGPGDIGENILTSGIDLPNLPAGSVLSIGNAVIEVTGLRDPCVQMDRYRPGLMAATLGRDSRGTLIRKAVVMAIVLTGGEVRPGDRIRVRLPPRPFRPLQPV